MSHVINNFIMLKYMNTFYRLYSTVYAKPKMCPIPLTVILALKFWARCKMWSFISSRIFLWSSSVTLNASLQRGEGRGGNRRQYRREREGMEFWERKLRAYLSVLNLRGWLASVLCIFPQMTAYGFSTVEWPHDTQEWLEQDYTSVCSWTHLSSLVKLE